MKGKIYAVGLIVCLLCSLTVSVFANGEAEDNGSLVLPRHVSGDVALSTSNRAATPTNDQWIVEFFPRLNFSGTPIKRSYNNIDFNWGTGSPDKAIPIDNFSAVLKKEIIVSEPTFYRIHGRADDGIKVYIDDKLILDQWKDGVNRFHKDILLSSGNHRIRVEYFEKKYSAALKVELTPVIDLVSDAWEASYFPNSTFSGFPIIRKINNSNLNLAWGSGSPDPQIPNDNFVATFQKRLTVNHSGKYVFEGRADDGIKIYIDGQVILNEWKQGVNNYRKEVNLSAGDHLIRVEYSEIKYSAAISLNITEEALVSEGWDATFYPKTDFQGASYKTNFKDLNLNWGSGSPVSGFPSDQFSAIFEKTLTVKEAGTYQFTGRADDGIRIFVDGEKIIDHWKSGVNSFSSVKNLSQGNHLIRVEYYEDKYSAAIKVDINQVETINNEWLATYYANKDLTGYSVKKKVGNNLDLNWGSGSPATGIPSDNFSATFERELFLDNPREYHFTGRADDGIRVYIDEEIVIDSWKSGINNIDQLISLTKGKHKIRVEYFEEKYGAAIRLSLNEYNGPTDRWLATYYPNKNFTGLAIKKYEGAELDLNWGSGSPSTGIPSDGFSAVFEKDITISASGTYELSGRADDGVRVFVDGKKVIEQWKVGVNTFQNTVDLSAGKHRVRVEYFDEKYSAAIKLVIDQASKKINYKQTKYPTRLSEALDLQMRTNPPPQTDSYRNKNGFVSKDYVSIAQRGVVKSDGVNLRTEPNTKSAISGKVNKGTPVIILDEIDGESYSGSLKWYKISYQNKIHYVHNSLVSVNGLIGTTTANVNIRETPSTTSHIYTTLGKGVEINIVNRGDAWHEVSLGPWRNAKRADVEFYLNPNNYSNTDKGYYQFLLLQGSSNINAGEVNNKVLVSKGILQGKASVFIEAAKKHNINEIYLISHALLETANGTSKLANGIVVNQVDGKPVTPKVVYNTYGIGANDACAERCGSEFAYKQGWFSVEQAIVGGASFIGEKYIAIGQNTLYKMRWNPAMPGTHQYATDIGWAVKQTTKMHDLYSILDTYTITFDFPVYQ